MRQVPIMDVYNALHADDSVYHKIGNSFALIDFIWQCKNGSIGIMVVSGDEFILNRDAFLYMDVDPFDAIFTAQPSANRPADLLCAVCSDHCTQLDHGVCVHCMLKASQALVTAADLWRDSIARAWISTHYLDRAFSPIEDLYYAVNAYVSDLIDWQSEYSCNVYNYVEFGDF